MTKWRRRRYTPLEQQTCRHRSALAHKSKRSCPYSETQGAFAAPRASCSPQVFLIGWPSLFLSEWGSGSKSSLCVMRSLSEGNTIRVERGETGGGLWEAGREKGRCVSRGGRGGEQQGRNKNRPLTLAAVTRTAEGSVHRTRRERTKSCFWSRPQVSSGSCSTGCGSFGFRGCSLFF